MRSIYLAGTITPDKSHTKWRDFIRLDFSRAGIEVLDPTRWGTGDPATSAPASVFVDADIDDLVRADVVLAVYRKGLPRQSVGTWCEVGIAGYLNKPIVVVTDDPEVAKHPFIVKFASIIVDNVDEGWYWAKRFCLPGWDVFGDNIRDPYRG